MSATDNTTAPVIEVPPKDETIAETPAQSAPVNTTTAATATGVNATGPKVTPVQRLNSVYKKAKQTVTEAVTEAQKALNEKKPAQASANTTSNDTTTAIEPENETSVTATSTTTEKKAASGLNTTLKDLLNRVKGLNKPTTSSHAASDVAPDQPVTTGINEESTAPVPPPKDSAKPSTSNTNPILDQLKRNSTLLSNYFLQKKKEFNEKKPSGTNNNEQSQVVHEVHATDQPAATTTPTTGATGEKTLASPLVSRITQLVHAATTTITKKKDQSKKQNQANDNGETTTTTTTTTTVLATVAVAADNVTTESPTAIGGSA